MDVFLYCTCGAEWKGRDLPPKIAAFVESQFRDAHKDEGHAPCDAATARRARSKSEKEETQIRRSG